MLAGLSSVIISDLGPTVAEDSLANVSIYVDRSVYRSVLTGHSIDLCWLACLLPASLILVSPTMAQNGPANVPIYVDRPVFRRYF